MTEEQDVDVAVVGAGPVGLLVASELALAGVTVQVLDRLTEPDATVKAGSINVATAEVLDRRGLLPAARRAQRDMVQQIARFRQLTQPGDHDVQATAGGGQGSGAPAGFPVAGHFAAKFFRPDLVDQADPELQAHTAIADATLVPQREVESMLTVHAAGLGVTVRRGVDVTGLRQDDSGVRLDTSAGPVTARWVVGADGGRSVIRKLAGIGFPGTDPEITGYQAIADLEGAEALQPGWTWSPSGIYSYGPIPGRILTVQFTGPPADRSAPVTPEELQASIRLVSGADVTVTALHGTATRWTDNARQAESYRNGRVLLAGDAAHVHSPFSGQGLNLGLGDASNLGWKLAATSAGWAPAGLLDTYSAERHPIGAWVLDWTRAQVALMRGDDKTGQLRQVVQQRLLATPETMTSVVKLTAGLGQRYLLDGSAEAATVDTAAEHPGPVGRLLGDVGLADGTRLADHAHRGRFVLLDRTPGHALSRLAQPWHDRVEVVTDRAVDGRAGTNLDDEPAGLLVRPDGVIIWAADTGLAATGLAATGLAATGPADGGSAADPRAELPAELEQALLQWAGVPAEARQVSAR